MVSLRTVRKINYKKYQKLTYMRKVEKVGEGAKRIRGGGEVYIQRKLKALKWSGLLLFGLVLVLLFGLFFSLKDNLSFHFVLVYFA